MEVVRDAVRGSMQASVKAKAWKWNSGGGSQGSFLGGGGKEVFVTLSLT